VPASAEDRTAVKVDSMAAVVVPTVVVAEEGTADNKNEIK